jgi:hypothetical protein
MVLTCESKALLFLHAVARFGSLLASNKENLLLLHFTDKAKACSVFTRSIFSKVSLGPGVL